LDKNEILKPKIVKMFTVNSYDDKTVDNIIAYVTFKWILMV